MKLRLFAFLKVELRQIIFCTSFGFIRIIAPAVLRRTHRRNQSLRFQIRAVLFRSLILLHIFFQAVKRDIVIIEFDPQEFVVFLNVLDIEVIPI